MMISTMNEIDEYERKKRKQIATMRSLLDYGLGIAIITAGIFLIIRDRLKLEFNEAYPPSYTDKLFGAVCILYGAWRCYRGYRKNYFK